MENKIKFKKYLIADGNSTLLVWNCAYKQRANIINKFLGRVEQIGFVSEYNIIPSLKMMGDELCINGTMAFALSQGRRSGKIYTSGIKTPVYYKKNSQIQIQLNIPFNKIENVILLSGIGYLCIDSIVKITKKDLLYYAEKYNLPAFGVIYYKNNIIKPLVYVKDTDSVFWESACGSGSVALNIFTNQNRIVQPSGKIITVKRNNFNFELSAEINEIPFNRTL